MYPMIFNILIWERRLAEGNAQEVPGVAAFYAEQDERHEGQPGWLLKAEESRRQRVLSADCRPMKQKKALL
jgi:hypothetical protein